MFMSRPRPGTKKCLKKCRSCRLAKAMIVIRHDRPYTRNVPVLDARVIWVRLSTLCTP